LITRSARENRRPASRVAGPDRAGHAVSTAASIEEAHQLAAI
jgi:hypothetical protein